MAMSVREVDIGPCSARAFEQDGARRWTVILPGAGYSTEAPLLWYAREAALAAGLNALAVADRFDRATDDPTEWVRGRTLAALRHVESADAHPLLIAKSLTSLAAGEAAEHGLSAVWLTPLINGRGSSVADEVRAALQGSAAPSLLIGGTADPTWDGAFARSLAHAHVVELSGADHSLQVSGDPQRSLTHLTAVTARVSEFIAAL